MTQDCVTKMLTSCRKIHTKTRLENETKSSSCNFFSEWQTCQGIYLEWTHKKNCHFASLRGIFSERNLATLFHKPLIFSWQFTTQRWLRGPCIVSNWLFPQITSNDSVKCHFSVSNSNNYKKNYRLENKDLFYVFSASRKQGSSERLLPILLVNGIEFERIVRELGSQHGFLSRIDSKRSSNSLSIFLKSFLRRSICVNQSIRSRSCLLLVLVDLV